MPLLDHFNPPVSDLRGWSGFHSAWATVIAESLNAQLVPPWAAETRLHFGLEIDVAGLRGPFPEPLGEFVLPAEYAPAGPSLTVALPSLEDSIEIEVIRVEGDREVVAAVELVSPANKDRPQTREAFVAKCESLLARGIGLAVVDLVTRRRANLHVELLRRLGEERTDRQAAGLYAAAYHPVEKDGAPLAEIWYEPLALGRPLPVLPLFLRDGPCVRLDLDETYRLTCERSCLDRDLNLLVPASATHSA